MKSLALFAVAVLAMPLLEACSEYENRALAGRFPVSGEVDRMLRDLAGMLGKSTEANAVVQEQKAWEQSRFAHCSNLAKMQSGKDAADGALALCFAAMDKQRAHSLRQAKLMLLVRQPAAQIKQAPAIKPSLALDTQNPGQSIGVSRDGLLAAVGSHTGNVDIYDVVSGLKLRSLSAEKYADNLWFSSNGRVLVTGSRQVRGIKIWDAHSGELLREHNGPLGPAALLPDDRHIVYADGDRIAIYDLIGDTVQPTAYSQRGRTAKLRVSPNGRRIATLSHDGAITVWDWVQLEAGRGFTLSKMAEKQTTDGTSKAWVLAFSHDGEALYTLDTRGTLVKRKLPDLQEVQSLTIARAAPSSIEALEDGRRLALAGSNARRGTYMLFLDLDGNSASITEIDGGNQIAMAIAPGQPHVYVATVRELRRVDVPKAGEMRSLESVLALLVEPPGPARTGRSPAVPVLIDVPTDATVEAVGVYGGTLGRGESRGRHPALPVTVTVGRTVKPVILVLASYEPIVWKIEKARDTQIRHILLSGYHESTVQGISGVHITRIGGAYAYDLKSKEYGALDRAVMRYLGRGIGRFQGAYTGGEFFIGAVSPTVQAVPGTTYKCRTANGNIAYEQRPCAEVGMATVGTLDAMPPQQPVSRLPDPNHVTIPSDGRRVIRCGGDTIVCGPGDTVRCGQSVFKCQ